MPFTLAHPAAVLSLPRRLGRLGCPAALVIGSMIPDLAYFLPLGVRRGQSHSLPGLLWFCIPAGLAAWFLYRLFVQPLALAVAPSGVVRRLRHTEPSRLSPAALAAAVVSLAVGAGTHVLWDSFTHESGFMVRHLPALRARVELVDGLSPHVSSLLFYASTVAGLGALALAGLRWYRSTPARELPLRRPLPRWLKGAFVFGIAVPSLSAVFYVLRPQLDVGAGELPGLGTIRRAVVASGTVFLVTLTLAAFAWRLMRPALARKRGS